MTDHIYPRFLGYDGSSDCVWELADGRWTWGNTAHDAADMGCTFEPVRYIEKYGRPVGSDEEIDRKAEADEDPAELAKLYLTESAPTDDTANLVRGVVWDEQLDNLVIPCRLQGAAATLASVVATVRAITGQGIDGTVPVTLRYEDGLTIGAEKALAAMKDAAQGWAEGAAENDEAMGRRDRKPADQQEFRVADILNMIDDAAREVGVEPVYSERSKRP